VEGHGLRAAFHDEGARTLAETPTAPVSRIVRRIPRSISRERRRINADAMPLDRWRERSPRVGSRGACDVVTTNHAAISRRTRAERTCERTPQD
jgi:hypothetical protein